MNNTVKNMTTNIKKISVGLLCLIFYQMRKLYPIYLSTTFSTHLLFVQNRQVKFTKILYQILSRMNQYFITVKGSLSHVKKQDSMIITLI